MKAMGNVIMFKPSAGSFHSVFPGEDAAETLSAQEESDLIKKALVVLNEMEEKWELDHAALELRDQFHLLRNYLGRYLKALNEKSTQK